MTKQLRIAFGVGAGDAIGAAYTRRFAAGGYPIEIARRDSDKSADIVSKIEAASVRAIAYDADARDKNSMPHLCKAVERDLGPIDVCLSNASANYRAPRLETTAEMFEKVCRPCCMGEFLTGREAAKYMVPRGCGSILFTGATASMRGGANFAAFAATESGLRGCSVDGT
jgi:NAD(P)-dependent dehydrogenase (short-subunit alcohol dehydrogenase family)